MQHRAFPRPYVFSLALAASACAGESSDDEDTGAATDTGSADDSPTTMPSSMTTPADDDGGTTDTPTEDTAPSEDSTSAPGSTDDGPADTGPGDSSGADGTTGPMGATITGTVRRSRQAGISPGNDGIGTFYVGVLLECTADAGSVGGNGIMNVDVSSTANSVEWEVSGIPDGDYFIAGFLDDNENADPNLPNADMGDLADADGFGPGCLPVSVAGAEVAAGEIVLDINIPF